MFPERPFSAKSEHSSRNDRPTTHSNQLVSFLPPFSPTRIPSCCTAIAAHLFPIIRLVLLNTLNQRPTNQRTYRTDDMKNVLFCLKLKKFANHRRPSDTDIASPLNPHPMLVRGYPQRVASGRLPRFLLADTSAPWSKYLSKGIHANTHTNHQRRTRTQITYSSFVLFLLSTYRNQHAQPPHNIIRLYSEFYIQISIIIIYTHVKRMRGRPETSQAPARYGTRLFVYQNTHFFNRKRAKQCSTNWPSICRSSHF